MAVKPLVAVELEGGCYVPLSHMLNGDGYFRKGRGFENEMFHRTMWKHYGGMIPEGFEIDHLCGNRACFNVEHLRCIKREKHLEHTNRTRYAERLEDARQLWIKADGKITGAELGRLYGVTNSTGCRWIKRWRNA